ncbi:OsmC family protein [Staphylococcus equorum]|uniref:OsmC family protein n=1 Tax=Staphylococcus equorum TaxID=246432 RepID=UPI003F56450B
MNSPKEAITISSIINWNYDIKGYGSIKGNNLDTKIAIPEELGGSGEGSDPKQILVSSAASCYIMTLVSIIETRKLPVIELTMSSEMSILEDNTLNIIHYPRIVLSDQKSDEVYQSADRALIIADKGCAIGNLLKKTDVNINIKGEITYIED